MSEADRIDMDVSVEDLATVREHLSLCSRAFSTATQRIGEYSKNGSDEYSMTKDTNDKSMEILEATSKGINGLAIHLSKLEDYVKEYLSCKYEG